MMKAVLCVVFAVLVLEWTWAETCQEEKDRLLAEVPRGPYGMLPLGFHLPDCLDDGSYAPVQCVEAECKCVSATGLVLVEFTRNTMGMNCLCARAKHEFGGVPGMEHLCNEGNGNYLPLQCKGSMCHCVDPRGNRIGEAVQRQDSASLDC